MPPDPRETELIEIAASVIGRMILAVDRGDGLAVASELGRLVDATIRLRDALAEPPGRREGATPLRLAALEAQQHSDCRQSRRETP